MTTPKPKRKSIIAKDGLENVVAGLGTDRDKRSYSVYGTPRKLTPVELENMYRSSWLAKKIVNAVADDMTRAWRTHDSNESNQVQVQKITQAEKRFALKAKVNDALCWARLYGGSAILIGTKDGIYDQPLDADAVKKGDLAFLRVIDNRRLFPSGGGLCTDISSDNFGLPEAYTLAEVSSAVIHHSRIVRFNGQKLPHFAWLRNNMWDDSELQHVLDSITNCDTATASVASMLFEANVDVIKTEGLVDLLSSKDGETKVIKRFQTAALLKSFNRTLLIDGNETYEKKSNNFSGLNLIIQEFMQDVSGAADIPMTRLFGRSAGGLNTTGDNDIRNYYDMLQAKQESELRPQLERLDAIMVRSELGQLPEDYGFTFNSLWQMSDKELADTEKTRAERDKIYFDMGVIDEGVIAADLKEVGTYANLTDEHVELAKELAEKMRETEVEPDDETKDPADEPQ